MGKATSFVFQVERATVSVNHMGPQIEEAVVILVVTVCRREAGVLGALQMPFVSLKHTTS